MRGNDVARGVVWRRCAARTVRCLRASGFPPTRAGRVFIAALILRRTCCGRFLRRRCHGMRDSRLRGNDDALRAPSRGRDSRLRGNDGLRGRLRRTANAGRRPQARRCGMRDSRLRGNDGYWTARRQTANAGRRRTARSPGFMDSRLRGLGGTFIAALILRRTCCGRFPRRMRRRPPPPPRQGMRDSRLRGNDGYWTARRRTTNAGRRPRMTGFLDSRLRGNDEARGALRATGIHAYAGMTGQEGRRRRRAAPSVRGGKG